MTSQQKSTPKPTDEEECLSCETTADLTAPADSFTPAANTSDNSISREHLLRGFVVEVPPDPELLSSCPNDSKHPLTIFIKSKIRPGCNHVFEEWLRQVISRQEAQFDGFLGAELIRPMNSTSTGGGGQEYVSIFRYNSYDNLQKWMKSSARAEMLKKTTEFVETPGRLTYHSLEFWFVRQRQQQERDNSDFDEEEARVGTNEDQEEVGPATPPTRTPPPAYKMAVVTFLVIWFLLHFVLPYGFSNIPGLSPLAIEVLDIALVVVLTTWVGMPIAVRVFSFWLFPQENYAEILKELIPSFLRN